MSTDYAQAFSFLQKFCQLILAKESFRLNKNCRQKKIKGGALNDFISARSDSLFLGFFNFIETS